MSRVSRQERLLGLDRLMCPHCGGRAENLGLGDLCERASAAGQVLALDATVDPLSYWWCPSCSAGGALLL